MQGERATDREALVTKVRRRKSGGRVGRASVLIWGDLASRLKGRRGHESRSEESAEAIVVGGNATKGRTMDERNERKTREGHAPEVRSADGARVEAAG